MASQQPHADTIDTAREAYREAEAQLVASCEELFREPGDAAAELLSIAEEFGADAAVERMARDPEVIGELRSDVDDRIDPDRLKPMGDAIEAVLDARDRLDLATAAERQQAAGKAERERQLVHIGGRPFEIDLARSEVRSLDDAGERYLLPAMELTHELTCPVSSDQF